jgi:peptide/nickel transport system substrate-binding protein
MRTKRLSIAAILASTLTLIAAAAVLAVGSNSIPPPPDADEGQESGSIGPSYTSGLRQGGTQQLLTFVEATIGEPATLDPHYQYDTASGEVIQQVYEPLIFPNREKTDQFVPMLAEALPEISPDGTEYTFVIRQGVKFHEGGDLTPLDVAYSFWRWMLQDRSGGPSWIILEPMFGEYSIDDVPGSDYEICRAVKSAVTYDNQNWTVTFHLDGPFDPMMEILASPWASVLDKEWMAANGGWTGNCHTWIDYHDPTLEESILYDQMNGTGPFVFHSWTSNELRLLRNDDYWRTEPIWDGGPYGPARLGEVVFKYESDAETRKDMLASGEADYAYVATQWVTVVNTLVRDEYDGGEADPDHLTILNPDGNLRSFNNLPAVSATDAFFTFDINENSPYIGSGDWDGAGIPTDFFSDLHVRKAFNYCFDWDTLIAEACLGEAEQRRGPILRGLMGYTDTQEVYTHSLTLCEDEFEQAWAGLVWSNGFSMTIPYNTGNEQRQKAAEIIKENVESITDTFHITVTDMPWKDYLDAMFGSQLPIFLNGWIEDYHHPHNWVIPYMHSSGAWAHFQNFPQATYNEYDAKIADCLALSAGSEAEQCYQDLQDIAHDDAIDIFLTQALERHYEQLWVNGYYHNPAYQRQYYFYAISKSVLETITSGAGGSLTYTDTNELTSTIQIPPGAVTQTTELRYTPLSGIDGYPCDLIEIGHSFDLAALISDTRESLSSLNDNCTVTVSYADSELGVAIEGTLALYYWDGSQWVKEPSSTVNTILNVVQGTPSHLSEWAVLGETNRDLLPLVLSRY